jgi:hypothetical protein
MIDVRFGDARDELDQEARWRSEEASAPAVSERVDRLEEASFVVLESGKIRFFATPRVDLRAPASLADVQRFVFTLAPRNRLLVRRIGVGRRRMPDDSVREREWAYVDRIGSAADVISDLGPRTYATKTRGVRRQAEAIELAYGSYAIATHRDHAHLLYELEAADDDRGALLRQLRVVPRGSYIVAAFNPEAKLRTREPSFERDGAPFSEPALYDDELMARFGKRRFAPLEPALLDREGAELVLIGGGSSHVYPTPLGVGATATDGHGRSIDECAATR